MATSWKGKELGALHRECAHQMGNGKGGSTSRVLRGKEVGDKPGAFSYILTSGS